MSASKKDYVAVANFISHELQQTESYTEAHKFAAQPRLWSLAQSIANHFAEGNHGFDRDHFLKAAGVK